MLRRRQGWWPALNHHRADRSPVVLLVFYWISCDIDHIIAQCGPPHPILAEHPASTTVHRFTVATG